MCSLYRVNGCCTPAEVRCTAHPPAALAKPSCPRLADTTDMPRAREFMDVCVVPDPKITDPKVKEHSPRWVEGSAARNISRPAFFGLISWVRGGQYLEAVAAAAAAAAAVADGCFCCSCSCSCSCCCCCCCGCCCSRPCQPQYLAGEVLQLSAVRSEDVGTLELQLLLLLCCCRRCCCRSHPRQPQYPRTGPGRFRVGRAPLRHERANHTRARPHTHTHTHT